jgi:flagellar biosynthesis/type III secretory pathway M-ring protein FliF/YscJ
MQHVSEFRYLLQAGPTYIIDIAVTVATIGVVLFFAAVILSNIPWARILPGNKEQQEEEEEEEDKQEEEEEESEVSKEKAE